MFPTKVFFVTALLSNLTGIDVLSPSLVTSIVSVNGKQRIKIWP